MISYTFKCPECGGEEIEEIQIRKVQVYVEDHSTGPELYEDEDEEYIATHWECNICGWRLPCRTVDDVVNLVVDQEIDRRT